MNALPLSNSEPSAMFIGLRALRGLKAIGTLPTEEQPQPLETITLRVENGRWVAVYSSERVKSLMGCATLPTAFAATVSAHEVATLVRERNPGVVVSVEGGES